MRAGWIAAILAVSALPLAAERIDLELAGTRGGVSRLAVQVVRPAGEPQGVLLLLHGYMANAGDFSFTTDWFTTRGWLVTTLELPGHGSSDGTRFDIDEFTTYGDAVALWFGWVRQQSWPDHKLVVAHSLGAASVLEALRRPGVAAPGPIIFCAPLLRTTWFSGLSLVDHLVGGWLPGLFSRTEQARAHWFLALERWLDRMKSQPSLQPLDLTVYQGDHDQVVDAEWNRKEMARLVPSVRWVVLPGKNHWFLSDQADRQGFHERLMADLGLGEAVP